MLPFCLQAVSLLDDRDQIRPEVQWFLDYCDVPRYETLDQVNGYLQEHWLQLNKERWELQPHQELDGQQLLPFLQKVGCIDPITAQKNVYDYALVLGATGAIMQERLDFLWQEYQRGVRFHQVVLLTGQRDLDESVEIFPENCATETDLLVYLFEKSPLCGKIPCLLIDSPKIPIGEGILRRPNTAKTVVDWYATRPLPGSCLAISNQPFVGYQEAVIRTFLPAEFTVEAVGPMAKISENFGEPRYVAVLLDNFAKWFYAELQCKNSNSQGFGV